MELSGGVSSTEMLKYCVLLLDVTVAIHTHSKNVSKESDLVTSHRGEANILGIIGC